LFFLNDSTAQAHFWEKLLQLISLRVKNKGIFQNLKFRVRVFEAEV